MKDDVVGVVAVVIGGIVVGCILGLAAIGVQTVIERHFTCDPCVCECEGEIHSTALHTRRVSL